ncbi:sensor histidine kinase [Candidatus Halobonum tyrrellensis]|uniref:histidine kinase n=1 Tax=Candidatus Halobonum tyrrellensis G22 TaxID=1324957 RepID=V4HIJ8_9EURY|nr:HAMP domain-containing sensor histidine kinase [Candidatus Halobonum tyrrellensis]ESP89608.1 multi-sensor signal transduction histidine kinase [Candidatus Halobonum tyrrellensis G22]
MSRSASPRWGGVIVAVGLGFTAVHARYLLRAPSVRVAVGSAVALATAAGVAALGVRLSRATDAERPRVVVRGVAIGVGVMALVFVIAVATSPLPAISARYLPHMAADLLTVGVAVGALLGLYDARSRRDRRRAEALFANLPSPAAHVDCSGGERVVVATNDAFRAAFGPNETYVGRPLDDCVPAAAEERSLSEALAEGPRARFRSAATAGHGVREFVTVTVPESVPDREYVVLSDITADGRRERRLSVLNRVLRHDLRSAMNVVLGHAELLADDPDDDHLATIRARVDGLLSMSRRARDLDHLLDGEASPRTVDLVAVVVDRLDARAADGTAFERSLPDRPVVVRDDGLLRAVLDELLDNAVEHAGSDPTIRVSVSVVGNTAELTVADDGPGIPDSERAVLSRERETTLDHASGLGLWFVTWVVSELGGDVDLTTGNRGDGGATVTVRLPLAADSADGRALAPTDGHRN